MIDNHSIETAKVGIASTFPMINICFRVVVQNRGQSYKINLVLKETKIVLISSKVPNFNLDQGSFKLYDQVSHKVFFCSLKFKFKCIQEFKKYCSGARLSFRKQLILSNSFHSSKPISRKNSYFLEQNVSLEEGGQKSSKKCYALSEWPLKLLFCFDLNCSNAPSRSLRLNFFYRVVSRST